MSTGGASFICSDTATARAVAKRTYEAAVELFAMQFDAHILALRLKKLRNKRNITQEHLAEMADLSTVYISYAI